MPSENLPLPQRAKRSDRYQATLLRSTKCRPGQTHEDELAQVIGDAVRELARLRGTSPLAVALVTDVVGGMLVGAKDEDSLREARLVLAGLSKPAIQERVVAEVESCAAHVWRDEGLTEDAAVQWIAMRARMLTSKRGRGDVRELARQALVACAPSNRRKEPRKWEALDAFLRAFGYGGSAESLRSVVRRARRR